MRGRWRLRKLAASWAPFPDRYWLLLRQSDWDAEDWVGFGWFPTWDEARKRGLEVAVADRW